MLRVQVVGGKGRYLKTSIDGIVDTHIEKKSPGPGK